MSTLTCRRCGDRYESGGDGYNGFCPSCADHFFSRVCRVCNEPVAWEGGRLHHVNEDGKIESDTDRHHAPVNFDDEPPQ